MRTPQDTLSCPTLDSCITSYNLQLLTLDKCYSLLLLLFIKVLMIADEIQTGLGRTGRCEINKYCCCC